MDLEHLDLIMGLLEIIHLLFRPSLSEVQLTVAERRIKTFTEMACRLHHGVIGIWNLHWLSHLPEDIRNFGPVYSFWCFASERFNKTLKNIKINGHVRQIPMTLMRVFQNFAHLREISTFGYDSAESSSDAINQVADCLRDIYARFSQEARGTSEQQRADFFDQDLNSSEENEPETLNIDLDTGRRTALDRLWTARLHNHLEVKYGSNTSSEKHHRFLRENDHTRGHDRTCTYVVTARVTTHRRISIGRKQFTAFHGSLSDDRLSETSLALCRDSFVEFRTQERTYGLLHGRAQVGLVVNIFSQDLLSLDKRSHLTGVYIVVRYLLPYSYSDHEPYHWRR